MVLDGGGGAAQQPPGRPSGDPERFELGARVLATDGDCGVLARVVVDPVAEALTHLVVAPKHHRGLGRLVPVALVRDANAEEIRLDCTVARFQTLDDAEDVRFLPSATEVSGYGPGGYGPGSLTLPYFGLGYTTVGDHHEPMFSDRIPMDEVEVQRGDQVHASDGWVGEVEGLVVDPADHHVTHVLLREGHLFARKQVAIPIGTTARVGDEVRVDLSKQEIEALPQVELASGS